MLFGNGMTRKDTSFANIRSYHFVLFPWLMPILLRSRLFGPERNLSEAAKYMALGAEKGCGRCFFYLGAMLALGEPETNLSARFKVLPGGNIEFRCHG